MTHSLGVAAALVGLVAFMPQSHAFTTVQGSDVPAASQARVADPDDLMQNMQDEQSSGVVSLPGGSGTLRFDGGSAAAGGASSRFVQEPGSELVPAQH